MFASSTSRTSGLAPSCEGKITLRQITRGGCVVPESACDRPMERDLLTPDWSSCHGPHPGDHLRLFWTEVHYQPELAPFGRVLPSRSHAGIIRMVLGASTPGADRRAAGGLNSSSSARPGRGGWRLAARGQSGLLTALRERTVARAARLTLAASRSAYARAYRSRAVRGDTRLRPRLRRTKLRPRAHGLGR